MKDALAELRACQGELKSFMSDVFDRLDVLAYALVREELAQPQSKRPGEQEGMQSQIEQLAALAAELAASVAEQKRMVTSGSHGSRRR